MTNTATDPRPAYAAVTAWVQSLLANVTEEQLALPTPCDEFDVRALAQHMNAVGLRAVALAESATVEGQPFLAEDHDAATYGATRERALAAWDAAPLEREVAVPWGVVPGFAALGMYVNETLVHGWDLAVATGQDPEFGDAAIVERALAVAEASIPAAIRGAEGVPFGPVVEPREGAGPTERLANWSGHHWAAA
ncbi:TIGR03086 family metal-binding protein [Tsukamurella paurometabola]|uniref:Mycothiol maleylpyruvate isomerase N-terminal domain n=1 Tax=Tsukamurella paurometabola TaxID=2061 RepID=A0A3P8JWK2_TSUPA|nr:TIGR03086 family metal-binding protein [Tsukamurella paurometabola]UEA85110.1 TIGR03086 family protein [Tsukamurella paurometabola]VDR37719.1 Mycothiol maleylpyruvate isomerase N-terminal domain [Tsukamurella paurometabola]